jgi:hypothetical protein
MSANATWNNAPAHAGPGTSSLWLQKSMGEPPSPASSIANNGVASVFAKMPSGQKHISKAAAMALFGRGSNGKPVLPPGVVVTPQKPNSMSNSMSVSALSHAMLRENNGIFAPSKAAVPVEWDEENNTPSGAAAAGGGRNAAFGAPPATKLRKETLMSLGISARPPPSRSPKSCMKKSGSVSGMRRAATLSSIHEVEVMLPGSRPISRNVSITFQDKVQVKRVPSSSSLAENPRDLWVQPEEEKQIRQIAKALVQVVDDSEVDPELVDIRGLEGHTRYVRKRIHVRPTREMRFSVES